MALHHTNRECFVPKDDLQTLKSFVKAAGQSHPTIHYAKVSDGLWSVFILSHIKEFLSDPNMQKKILVTCWTAALLQCMGIQ